MSDWTGELTPIASAPRFCTVADVAAFLQITIAADSTAALAAIEEASAAIQNYCHQQIAEVEDDEVTFDITGRQTKLFLPELPVNGVSEVLEDGETLTVADDYKLGNYGILHRIGSYWATGVQVVTVTYSHGYGVIPDDVVNVCVRAAARRYQAGLRSEATDGISAVQGMTLGDYSVQYGSEQSGGASGGSLLGSSAAPMLLMSEKGMLHKYRYVPA